MSSQSSSMTSREESEFASRVLNPLLTVHGDEHTDSGKSAELLYDDDEVFPHPPRRRDQIDRSQMLVDRMYELPATATHYDPILRSEFLAQMWLKFHRIPSALQCQVRPDIQSHPFKISALSNVYAGFLEDGTPVALKAYRLSEDNLQSKVRQFFLEAEIWKSLSHPSILEFYGISVSKGNLYLVSPLMKGSTLPEFLAANPKSEQEKLVILAQIANGLAYLHSRPTPVLHGDCRGVNVLVNEKGEPVIADFGCSMIIHPSSPNPRPEYHLHAGSPRWTAPEKLRKSQHPLGLESDIYALACLAIELFSERIPFHHLRNDAQVIIEVLVKRRHPSWPEDLPSSDSFRCLLPLLVLCWSHDPTQRPSISEFQQILASYPS